MKKQTAKTNASAITIPRSFAALSRVASRDPEAHAWMRTVRIEALARGRVSADATDGHTMLRMTSDAPEVNLDLFGAVAAAAPDGTVSSVGAEDLACVVKAVKSLRSDDPPPVEIVVGPDPVVRCGSAVRRVQVEGDGEYAAWPMDPGGLLPPGPVACAQLVSAEKLRDLAAAIVAAGVATIKVEMRGGLVGIVLVGEGENGEAVVGLLMPIRAAGEVSESSSVTVEVGGESVTVTGEQFDRAMSEAGKP